MLIIAIFLFTLNESIELDRFFILTHYILHETHILQIMRSLFTHRQTKTVIFQHEDKCIPNFGLKNKSAKIQISLVQELNNARHNACRRLSISSRGIMNKIQVIKSDQCMIYGIAVREQLNSSWTHQQHNLQARDATKHYSLSQYRVVSRLCPSVLRTWLLHSSNKGK